MSDFDTVLERLMSDPGFRSGLAADPAAALRGYRLSAEEVELLHSQVDSGSGGNSRVEERTSKASLFGLLSPLLGAAGLGGEAHSVPTDGAVGKVSTGGYEVVTSDEWYLRDGMGGSGHSGLGDAAASGADGIGTPLAPPDGSGLIGQTLDLPPGGGVGAPPPADYHPHVDVNGDGHWDQYTVQGRTDGGVDLVADMNHDGRADFIGHDYNRDGLVDAADYDEDRNGTFETHMRDVNHDGWLDTRSVDREPSSDGVVGRHRVDD